MNTTTLIVFVALIALVFWLRPRPDVDGKKARALVAEGALLLDVRSPQEFAAGHIDGAKNIPVDELPRRIAGLDPATPIVVYCQSGMRSARAKKALQAAGLRVSDLGSRLNW